MKRLTLKPNLIFNWVMFLGGLQWEQSVHTVSSAAF